MSDATAPQHRLGAVVSSLTAVATSVKKIHSSVMGPYVLGGSDNVAKCSVLLSEPGEGWGQGPSETVLKTSLAAIMADAGAQQLLDTTLVPRIMAMSINIREECIASVQTPAQALADSLIAIANGITTIKERVAKLDKSSAVVPLRVSSASGLSNEQIWTRWIRKRKTIAIAFDDYSMVEEKNDRLLEELVELTGDEATAARLRTKDNEKYMALKRVQWFSAYGDARTIMASTEAYEKFPLPAKISGSNYEKFKEQLLAWCKRESTIKKYPMILYDIEFMVDSVDPRETKHLLPPDNTVSGPLLGYDADNRQGYRFSDGLEHARKVSWEALYAELYTLSTPAMQQWIAEMHSVGQLEIQLFSVAKQDGMRFIYAVLNAHIRYNDQDQHGHLTVLRNLSNGFSKGGNVEEVIEDARRKLHEAKTCGVVPSYEQGGSDCILALSAMNNDIWQVLQRGQYLHPDCKALSCFDAQDCTQLLHFAFKAALEVWKRSMHLDDKKGTKKRKHSEATEEVTALTANAADHKKSSLSKPVRKVMRGAMETYETDHDELTPRHKELIYKFARDSEYFKTQEGSKQVKEVVTAMSMMLTNGQELSEPVLRNKVQELRKSKGKGGKGKGGKGGDKSSKGKGKGAANPRDDAKPPVCKALGCTEKMSKDRQGKWYVTCYDHSLEWRKEGRLTFKDGFVHEHWSVSQEGGSPKRGVKARQVTLGDVSKSSTKDVTFVGLDGSTHTEKVDAATIEVLMRAKQNQLRLQTPVPTSDSVMYLLGNN